MGIGEPDAKQEALSVGAPRFVKAIWRGRGLHACVCDCGFAYRS